MQPDPEYVREWMANIEAKRLRDRGVSYNALAIVMEEVRGVVKTPNQWRAQLRRQGIGPSKGPRKVIA